MSQDDMDVRGVEGVDSLAPAACPTLQVPGQPGRVRAVEEQIFLRRFAPDCMTHACRCRDEGDRLLLDACCQHGADVDLFEKAAILKRKDAIALVLRPEFSDPALWFDESDPYHDDEYPSGTCVRTGRATPEESSGCVFLQHDQRGCALHRAALQGGFAPEEIKPMVCRLYPLAFGESLLGLSDDYPRYSCADDASGPTLYRLMRETLGSIFGLGLIRQLDTLERRVLGRRLPLAARIQP
jgi:hypothetical protein